MKTAMLTRLGAVLLPPRAAIPVDLRVRAYLVNRERAHVDHIEHQAFPSGPGLTVPAELQRIERTVNVILTNDR